MHFSFGPLYIKSIAITQLLCCRLESKDIQINRSVSWFNCYHLAISAGIKKQLNWTLLRFRWLYFLKISSTPKDWLYIFQKPTVWGVPSYLVFKWLLNACILSVGHALCGQWHKGESFLVRVKPQHHGRTVNSGFLRMVLSVLSLIFLNSDFVSFCVLATFLKTAFEMTPLQFKDSFWVSTWVELFWQIQLNVVVC